MTAGSAFFPVVGVVLSNVLYFSSWPAVQTAYTTGRLGSLNVLPTALMVVSSISWMTYALAISNGYIMASNLPGAIATVAFTVVLLPLIPRENASARLQVQCVLVFGTAAELILWTCLVFSDAGFEQRKFALGLYSSGLCVALFASPLSTAYEVITTANAASIYAPLTVAQCTNCLMWTIYGVTIGDVWVFGPNGTGLVLGLIQLVLKCLFSSAPSMRGEQKALRPNKDSSKESDIGSDDNEAA